MPRHEKILITDCFDLNLSKLYILNNHHRKELTKEYTTDSKSLISKKKSKSLRELCLVVHWSPQYVNPGTPLIEWFTETERS